MEEIPLPNSRVLLYIDSAEGSIGKLKIAEQFRDSDTLLNALEWRVKLPHTTIRIEAPRVPQQML